MKSIAAKDLDTSTKELCMRLVGNAAFHIEDSKATSEAMRIVYEAVRRLQIAKERPTKLGVETKKGKLDT